MSADPTPAALAALDLDAIKARRDAVMKLTFDLAKDGEKAFRMSIPLQQDDADVLLLKLCDDVDGLLAAARRGDQAADNFDMMVETWGRERDDSTRYWHALKAISDFTRAYGEEWSQVFNELQRLARVAIEPHRNAAVREPNRNESTTPRAEAGGALRR